MSTDHFLPAPVFSSRRARFDANAARPYKTYKFTPTGQRYGITIKDLQARRLEAKNQRRAANGLPPRQSYAEI